MIVCHDNNLLQVTVSFVLSQPYLWNLPQAKGIFGRRVQSSGTSIILIDIHKTSICLPFVLMTDPDVGKKICEERIGMPCVPTILKAAVFLP